MDRENRTAAIGGRRDSLSVGGALDNAIAAHSHAMNVEIRQNSRGRFNYRIAGAPYPYNRFGGATYPTEEAALAAAERDMETAEAIASGRVCYADPGESCAEGFECAIDCIAAGVASAD